MNATPTTSNKDGVQYDYKLSLVANLLNPPELLVYRCLSGLFLLVSIWHIFYDPNDPVAWSLLILAAAYSWYFAFRHGLPFYGKMISLAITKDVVACEISGNFRYVPRNQVTVRKGLAGTHIISRPAHGDYLLVSKDAIGFDQLKAEITAPSSASK